MARSQQAVDPPNRPPLTAFALLLTLTVLAGSVLEPAAGPGGAGGAGEGALEGPTPPPAARRLERVNRRVDAGAPGQITETQHAVCEVSTEELVAKAEATVTRVLTGLCNAKEMEARFLKLGAQLDQQLNAIKAMILNVEDRLQEQDAASRRAMRRLATAAHRCDGTGDPTKRSYAIGVGEATAFAASDAPVEVEEEPTAATDTAEGQAGAGRGDTAARAASAREAIPRGDEIRLYNSSIHTLPDGQDVFSYYWRVSGISYKLTHWESNRSLRSPSFYISQGGYRMYLRMFPRRSGVNAYVHAGLTPGAFDETLTWPFALKLRVSVLEQSAGASEDVTSRVWDATERCTGYNWQVPLAGDSYECVGLGLPHKVIRSRRYIWQGSILIKLTVFMS